MVSVVLIFFSGFYAYLLSPGRFIFSYSVKMFASFLLKSYDCELPTPRKNWTWGENSIPDSRNLLLMRPKNVENNHN